MTRGMTLKFEAGGCDVMINQMAFSSGLIRVSQLEPGVRAPEPGTE
jgi:hypothetical protein